MRLKQVSQGLVILFLCCVIALPIIAFRDIEVVDGRFYSTFIGVDNKGNTSAYYQFKSNDNEVWWILTEKELGFIPQSNTEYSFAYSDNGTIKGDKVCDCSEDCECYMYDDVFIGIKEKR